MGSCEKNIRSYRRGYSPLVFCKSPKHCPYYCVATHCFIRHGPIGAPDVHPCWSLDFLRLKFYATPVMLQIQVRGLQAHYTSSSAVAKRLRDALCLSVVSFNSTKRRVESFIVSYVGYRFVTAFS